MSKQKYEFNKDNEFFMEKLTNLLKYYYKGKFNQTIVAKELNISKQTLSYYLNGVRVPSFSQMKHILDFCKKNIKNFNTDYFFYEKEPIITVNNGENGINLDTDEIDTINEITDKKLTNEFKIILNQKKELIDFLNEIKDIFVHYAYFRNQYIIKMIDFDASIFFQIQYSILESKFKDLFLKILSEDSFCKYFTDLEYRLEDMDEDELNKELKSLNKQFINLIQSSNKKDSTN